MKSKWILSSLFLSAAVSVGCGDGEPQRATDGADLDAIQAYEDAVAAAEQQSVDSEMEEEAAAGE